MSGSALAEQFRAVAELHGDVAWIVDCASGLPAYISPGAAAMSGYDIDDVIAQLQTQDAKGPLHALCAGLHERLHRFASGDLTRKRLVRSFELRLADGRVLPIQVDSTIVTGAGGAASAVVGTVRDISGLRERAEQQRRFTSMLNHEFRTPLSTIDGAIQRLEATGANADDATRQRYRKIGAAVDRLIGMMDDYLSPERMAAAGGSKPADSASPAQLLEEAAGLVKAAGRNATLEIGELPGRLRCQPNGLRLALKVLVDNALQYSPPQQPIMLAGERADGGIVLLVRDGGEGVPSAELAAIFGKRYRGTNAVAGGSGLGLYMAKSVIEVHGGNLTVQNVAPFGAEFRIWLPAQAGEGKSVASKVINSDNSANQVQG